jgi:hypothetical protein
MAGEAQDKVWPLLKFYFKVKIADQEVRFQEVSGGVAVYQTPVNKSKGSTENGYR